MWLAIKKTDDDIEQNGTNDADDDHCGQGKIDFNVV